MKKKDDKYAPAKAYIRYGGLASQMIVSVLLGLWLGQWIDEKLQMRVALFTIICSLGALVASFYLLIKDLQRNQ